MKNFVLFMGCMLAVMIVFHYATLKYLNPYKLIMVFGKKGSGKSTLLTKLSLQYQKKNIPIYSTEYVVGTYKINYEDIGFVEFPRNSVLLIDEVGMIWDSRRFKDFKPEVRDWFKLQRHRGITVYLFSQTFDVDKKIRDLVDEMYLVEKRLRVFSYAKCIYKRIVLTTSENSKEGESRISEDLVFAPWWLAFFGSRRLTFIPRYVKYFDSFTAPPLLVKEFASVPMPEYEKVGLLSAVRDRVRRK